MERREHDEIFNLTEGVHSFQVKNHFPGKFVSRFLAQSVLDESSRNRVQFPKKCIIVSIWWFYQTWREIQAEKGDNEFRLEK